MTSGSTTIRPMTPEEMPLWGAMRSKLWPDCLAEDNARDFADFVTGRSALKIVFLAFIDDTPAGFAEISERNVADGCGNEPVAYLEGWFVEPGFRRQGIGGALVMAATEWARKQRYAYLASDTELHNVVSQQAHAAQGFQEVSRVVTYSMKLKPPLE